MEIYLNKKSGVYFNGDRFYIKNNEVDIETLPVNVNNLFMELLEGIYNKEDKSKAILLRANKNTNLMIVFPKEQKDEKKPVVLIRVYTFAEDNKEDEKKEPKTYICKMENIINLVNALIKRVDKIYGKICIERTQDGWKAGDIKLTEEDYMAIRKAIKEGVGTGRNIKITDKYISFRTNPETRITKFEEILYALLT
ncbi:MAG: hypothetical protein QXX30_00885 [Candidatus Aenigmatarchaeota archaeon]